MFTGDEPPPPIPNLEDAEAFLVAHLKQPKQADRTIYGYDVYLPNVVEDFCLPEARKLPSRMVPPRWVEHLSAPFYEAAWNLCRLGVLRPGTLHRHAQAEGDGAGYCVTSRGKTWLAEQESGPPFIPTDVSRTADLLASAGARFGEVYHTRATEAAVCYAAGAYYACCAMAGAAAECVVLAVGAARLGEKEANRVYYAKDGRRKLMERLLNDIPPWLAHDFRGHTALVAMWRDRSAHAHDSIVGEGEAYMALRTLLRFATQVSEHWPRLSAPIAPPTTTNHG
jgi:hypothetical protein